MTKIVEKKNGFCNAFFFKDCSGLSYGHMWSWLPDELLERIVQLVAQRAPRSLAILASLDQRSRTLAAARLACMKPLFTAPFRLPVNRIFSGEGTVLLLRDRVLRSEHMEVLGNALVSGALAQCTFIDLSFNQIGDAGLSALAGALSSGALAQCTFIGLGDTQIGDVGLTALALACASGALAQCTYINLMVNQIGDAGFSALAGALSSGALASLKQIMVDNKHMRHPQLVAACLHRGIKII